MTNFPKRCCEFGPFRLAPRERQLFREMQTIHQRFVAKSGHTTLEHAAVRYRTGRLVEKAISLGPGGYRSRYCANCEFRLDNLRGEAEFA